MQLGGKKKKKKLWPATEERKIKEQTKRRENTLGTKIVFSSALTVLGIITLGFKWVFMKMVEVVYGRYSIL